MSKVNELRRKASDAVRGREFDSAIELYQKICKLDPSNGTPCNELGDLYLKTGNTRDAIESFSLSARLYSDFGLTNNAVAVYKKILRHDPNHLASLWGLAEIRREQGMDAEASAGFLEFLSRAEQVPEAGRMEFFKNAGALITTMGDDLEILSRLEEIYRATDRGDDVAKVLIAKARQAHIEGEIEVRDRYIEHAREACEILESLPAFKDYRDVVDPVAYSGPFSTEDIADEAPAADSGVIELDEDTSSAFDVGAVKDLALEDSAPRTVAINTESLDLGFDFSAEDLDMAVSHAVPTVQDLPEEAAAPVAEQAAPVAEPAAPEKQPVAEAVFSNEPDDRETAGTLNLLDEILADGAFGSQDVEEDQMRQVETIAAEMKGQIAGDVDADDYGGQYELGVVYMDMGLFEQAVAAFEAAAMGDDYCLGSLEMRGTCLLRLGRDGEAMASFREGLTIKGAPEKAYLGLLYGVGSCLDLRGEMDEAREYFQRVAAVDAKFLDVAARLEKMGEPR